MSGLEHQSILIPYRNLDGDYEYHTSTHLQISDEHFGKYNDLALGDELIPAPIEAFSDEAQSYCANQLGRSADRDADAYERGACPTDENTGFYAYDPERKLIPIPRSDGSITAMYADRNYFDEKGRRMVVMLGVDEEIINGVV